MIKLVTVSALICASLALFNLDAAEMSVPEAVDAPQKVRPIVVGSELPNLMVEKADGIAQGFRDALGQGKHVVIVYRGGWCPYCTRHFAAIGMKKDALKQAGWNLASLSPDNQASIKAWVDKNGDDGVQRLSDSDADVIRALGLAFVLDEKTREIYKKYNIDLVAASGETHNILPVPTVLLVVDGVIRGLHADIDYKRRLHPEVLMAMTTAIDADTMAAAQKK